MQVDTVYAGQGDSAIVTHAGEAIVVDVYWPEEREEERAQEVNDVLENQEVRGIIITGYDEDHGHPRGLEHYLNEHGAKWVLMPKAYDGDDKEKQGELQKICRKASVKHHEVSLEADGSEPEWLQDLMGDYFEAKVFSPHKEDANSSNNAGIVMKLSVTGEWSYLVTGDTENDRWETINTLFGEELKSHMVSIPHHGAENGTNEDTAAHVGPKQAVASAGVDNQYDHPRKEAMEIWKKYAETRATNEDGGTSLTTWKDGEVLRTTAREEFESIQMTMAGKAPAVIVSGGWGAGTRRSGIAYGEEYPGVGPSGSSTVPTRNG